MAIDSTSIKLSLLPCIRNSVGTHLAFLLSPRISLIREHLKRKQREKYKEACRAGNSTQRSTNPIQVYNRDFFFVCQVTQSLKDSNPKYKMSLNL